MSDSLTNAAPMQSYNCGVLLHNWYEDRFAPRAGSLADVYPVPPTTHQEEFHKKSAAIRPMLRTGDLGKDLLFGQGGVNSVAPPLSTTSADYGASFKASQASTMKQQAEETGSVGKFASMKEEWRRMRDPETAGQLETTKSLMDAEARKRAVAEPIQKNPRKTGFTASHIREHENLGLRN